MKTFIPTPFLIAPRAIRWMLLALLVVPLVSGCGDDDPDEGPDAAFTFAASGLEVTFTSTTTGDIDAYSWDFGDGQAGSGVTTSHTYAAAGSYSVTLTVTSASGDDSETQTVTVEASSGGNSSPTPTFPDADGIMVAINSTSFAPGPFPIEINNQSGVASFGESPFVGVGDVTLDGNTLMQNANNTYTYVSLAPGKFEGNVVWTAAGGNGFAAINRTVTIGFPTISKIQAPGTVALNSDLTISTTDPISNADSVLFTVADPSGTVLIATLPGSTSSHTFSAAELGTLSTGQGIVQIAAYRAESEGIGGKNIYFVNESVTTAFVTLQ
ncbi:MAG: PKD domain-containing protein [Bacteroidota bacterium]